MSTYQEGLKVSLLAGALVGLAYALIGIVLAAIMGSDAISSRGLSVAQLIGAYIGGGIVGGVVVGLFHPVARRHAVFAAVVGYVAVFPFMLGASLMMGVGAGHSPFLVPGLASVVGAGAGWLMWHDEVGK